MSLQGIDVVTPSGELVHADKEQNTELLWAARGAGPGFFGVVTRFTIALQPLPKAIKTSTYVYELSDLETVARWASEAVTSLLPTVELTLLLAAAPPEVSAENHGKALILTATAFVDSPEEAADALAPLEGSPVLHRALSRRVNEASPFETLFRDFGGRWPEGRHYASDNVWTDAEFADTLIPLCRQVLEAPSPESFAFAVMSPPEPEGAPPLPDMAFSMVARSFVSCYAVWGSQADDEANMRWLPSAIAEVEPLAVGHYVGEADLLAAARAQRSFAQPNWERLQAIGRELDPDRLFHPFLAPNDRPAIRA